MITIPDKKARAEIEELRQEIQSLRREISALKGRAEYYGPTKKTLNTPFDHGMVALNASEIIARFKELYAYLNVERQQLPEMTSLIRKTPSVKTPVSRPTRKKK